MKQIREFLLDDSRTFLKWQPFMCVLQAGPAAATAMSPPWINGRCCISFVLKPGKQTLPMLIFLFFFKKEKKET